VEKHSVNRFNQTTFATLSDELVYIVNKLTGVVPGRFFGLGVVLDRGGGDCVTTTVKLGAAGVDRTKFSMPSSFAKSNSSASTHRPTSASWKLSGASNAISLFQITPTK
jgi:hypothetical protein